jgi:capsid protein
MPSHLPNAVETFGAAKASYQGMVDNRFRRRRPGVGSIGVSGDYHAQNESAFIRMREYVRAADRDDSILGALADRAADNQVQGGFTPEPQTGDPEVDKILLDKWWEWALDKDLCDASGTQTFPEMEWSIARAEMIDGDIFSLPINDGSIQLVEAHRCRTPSNSRKNIVHGIEMDNRRRRIAFYFTKEDISPLQQLKLVGDAPPISAYDSDGNPQVDQIFKPHRLSQTRGVTWFRGVIDLLTQVEDTTFATSIKAQIAACAVWSWERDLNSTTGMDMRTGERSQQVLNDNFSQAVDEGVSPGQMFQPPAGTKLNVHTPNIPGDNYLAHARHLLSLVGIQVGVPLFMLLLDPSEGSFSSLRVAWDQAILGFKRTQQRRVAQWYSPTWRRRARFAIADEPLLATAAQKLGPKIFAHQWNAPGWKYLQPVHDASAAAIRLQTGQISLRRFHAENGTDFQDVVRENVKDIEFWLEEAAQAHQRFAGKYPELVKQLTLHDFYYRDFFKGGQLIDTAEKPNEEVSSTSDVKPGKK